MSIIFLLDAALGEVGHQLLLGKRIILLKVVQMFLFLRVYLENFHMIEHSRPWKVVVIGSVLPPNSLSFHTLGELVSSPDRLAPACDRSRLAIWKVHKYEVVVSMLCKYIR